jgi:hypothetical protein
MLPYRWVMTERVNHWRPARSCFLQAVNENHGGPRGIELLQPGKHCRICIGFRVHDTREPKPFRTFTSDQERRGRIKISCKRKGLLVQRDSFGVQRIDELQARFVAGEADDRGDRRVDAV